ncbi:MAG TPA: ABC transporter ATP-binding protein [Burkholderiales bacterium]|jgi:branched-chain amino acid transport system ATP-binding protein|nr:ABC transporter ATP-binding protein [Burkholderiales bacterium]
MLSVRNLSKSFGGVGAMNDVSLEFAEDSLTAVIGPNGAGKTTFFNLITGAFAPDSGRIVLAGEDIAGLGAPEIVRRGIGRAFQIASIFPTLTVREAILGAVNAHRGWYAGVGRRFPLKQARSQADEVLDLVKLGSRADKLSGTLSHGDQKLLDIALALALEPRVLLLDEPTAGMGPEERWQMIDTVHQLWQRKKMTLIFIEHDMDIVFKYAQTIRVLSYGTVLAQGLPDEIRAHPKVIEAYLGAHFEAGQA